MAAELRSADETAFDEILTLARRQLEALRSSDVDAYLRLATQRELATRDLPTLADPGLRKRARFLLEAAREVDAKSEALLQSGLAEVRAEMYQLSQGRQAVRGYQKLDAPSHVGALA